MVGQNDVMLAQYLDPPLTSVAHAVRDMARQGTELLFEKIDWPAEEPWTPRRVAYEPRLVVRESSQAPPSDVGGVTGVVFSLNGHRLEVPQGDGSSTSAPLGRASYPQLTPR